MIRDILELDHFIVLIESTNKDEKEIATCRLEEETIGISFYGSGNVDLEITYGNRTKNMQNRKGIAFSFFGNNKVEFSHKISHSEPLQNISIFSTIENIQKRTQYEKDLYYNHLEALTNSKECFEMGPVLHMTPEMHTSVKRIFNTTYKGPARLLYLKSQVTELLSHYFALIHADDRPILKHSEKEKIQKAQEIISDNIDAPPSINELSTLIGLNSSKLQKNFKQLFGVPVFKYIQHERLSKAHRLLSQKEMTVQEVAWYVGYESLSSFSNAFLKEFGCRPSQILK